MLKVVVYIDHWALKSYTLLLGYAKLRNVLEPFCVVSFHIPRKYIKYYEAGKHHDTHLQ